MSRKHTVLVVGILGLALVVLSQARSGEPAPTEKSKAPEKAVEKAAPADTSKAAKTEKPKTATPGPKRAEFDQLFGEWKKLVAEILRLREESRRATVDQSAANEKTAQELIQRAQAMQPKLAAAAEAAYVEAPMPEDEAGAFLLGIALQQWQNDDYEESLRVCKILIDHGYGDKLVYAPAGWSAFCTNDFDLAEKYLGMAQESTALERLGAGTARMGGMFLKQIPLFYRDAWKREQGLRILETKADDLPQVLLKTTKGDITLELFENEAPNTVANFISLVEKKFYDGTPFHRVLSQFMAQGGDPKGDGTGGPGYTIEDECSRPDHRNHFRGSLSMAHEPEPNTGGSQFFLALRPIRDLDGMHTVFGRIIKGMDVLAKLQRIDPEHPDPSIKPDKIVEATVLRKRPHPYEPKVTKKEDPKTAAKEGAKTTKTGDSKATKAEEPK